MSTRRAERKASPLSEIARVLARFDHVAHPIAYPNHSIMRSAAVLRVIDCRARVFIPQPAERQRNRKSDQSRDDAEHFVGELGPTFPVVRSTSESTPQTEGQCAEKLTF